MKKIELLAPAGSIESLYGAVNSGADAVYLGGNKFSARAYASNFDEENMIKAVDYCHIYGVKIYVTVNTLLKEEELGEALDYTKFLYEIGVDGLIIQDVGLAKLIKSEMGDFELHASTQMTVHNFEGAKLLQDIGFKRVVLSRELSLEEIKYISNNLDIETEIFIHGALCICYSGQCLISSLIGGRSGNRGRCAQPCRLPYSLIEEGTEKEKKGYLLSPKDISTFSSIEDIVLSGATSLKIEGRMKRPEYVAGVVDTYRRAIDKVLSKDDTIDYPLENKKLMQLFNREGFSKAYLYGNEGKDMMAYNFPKNTGLLLGKVDKNLNVILKEDISLKDGVRNGEGGFTISKIIKEHKEVEKGHIGEKVKIHPINYKPGDVLFKTSDVELLKSYEGFYETSYRRKVKLSLSVDFKVNSPIIISTEINGERFHAEGEIVQKALKRPLDKNKILENLIKTGDTPFQFEEVVFNSYEEGFLPLSSINEVRRSLLDKVLSKIADSYKRQIKRDKSNNRKYTNNAKEKEMPEVLVFLTKKEQLKGALELKVKDIAINPFIRSNEIDMENLKNENINIYLKIPNIIKGEFEFVCSFIEKNLPYIKGIITGNLGIVGKFKEKISIIGDYKINVFNSESLNFYNDFIQGSCISVELNKKEIEKSFKQSHNSQILLYGKIEVMISEYCPIGSTFGGQNKNSGCDNYCNKKEFKLMDRMGEKFLTCTDKFCRSYIYNPVALNLIPNINEISKMGINNFRLDFIDENYEEVVEVIKSTLNKTWNKEFNNYTRGHYKRGVE